MKTFRAAVLLARDRLGADWYTCFIAIRREVVKQRLVHMMSWHRQKSIF